jgi:hypothetical protein
MRRPSLAISASFFALACAGSAAMADVAFSPTNTTIQNGSTGNDGLVFTVGASNILITHLGEFNGTNMSHDVGIFKYVGGNASGPALIQASITTNNSLSGFSYTDVSSLGVTLSANTQYILVGFTVENAQMTATIGDTILGSGIASFDSYRYNNSGSFDGTMTSGDYSPVYFGPNFQYAVPSPGALALLGLAGLSSRRRR